MIKPAILYADEIRREFQKRFYSIDMFYETGDLGGWAPNIEDHADGSNFQFAIVDDDDNLLGYISYYVDWHANCAYNFGMMSFQKGSYLFGKDINNIFEDLVTKFHRVEWRAIGGNPACRSYDAFIKRHNGNKYILKDRTRDSDGVYHDDIIYEIVNSQV